MWRLGMRCLGYFLVGSLLFGWCGTYIVTGFSGRDVGFWQFIPVWFGGLAFGWAALCSAPQQDSNIDEGMLSNLLIWSYLTLIFGAVLIPVFELSLALFSVFTDVGGQWVQTYDQYRPIALAFYVVALEIIGVHLALVRVARKREESELKAKAP